MLGAGIAQWIKRRATRWTAEELRFGSLQGNRHFLLHSVKTVYGAHPALYPMGTADVFLKGKAAVA
jgi:hypothetical protein